MTNGVLHTDASSGAPESKPGRANIKLAVMLGLVALALYVAVWYDKS